MKKVLSLLVVLSMIVSTLPVNVSATHWADEDVAYLVENGAIAEDDAMLNNLDAPITRSQMVKVIVALLDGEEPIEGKEYFTDITAEDTHIAKAAENGFVNGFGDGTFRPNNPITRQDFFTIVGRAYKLEGTATSEFTDADAIADYAKPYVDALQSISIVNGYGDGTVNPRGNITIAETLAVMRRTDEHVKANAPEEPPEEEEKPKPSSGGGGSSGGGHGTGAMPLPPGVRFSIELENDFTGKYVGYLTAEVSGSGIQKMMLLRSGGYSITGSAGYDLTKQEIAEESGQYISEKDGKYALPDFGEYELYILTSNGLYIKRYTYNVTVNPPLSSDSTAPELNLEVVGDTENPTYPITLNVTATDDAGIAKISYLKDTGLESTKPSLEMDFKVNVNGRQIITGDSITIDAPGRYTFCAMDVNGYCTYRQIDAFDRVSITDCEYGAISPDLTYSFDADIETTGPLEVSVENDPFAPAVYFVQQNYLTTLDGAAPLDKKVCMVSIDDLDLSQDIETLMNQEKDKEAVCIVKDNYNAMQFGSGVKRTRFEGDTINLTKNGVYYIFDQNSNGNLTLVRFSVNNIKTASATFNVEIEEDTSSEYVAHVTATATANPNAPVKQMFVVKSDYEPESAGAYREYTPNGKAQKIWDEVSVSGEYIPVEESKFSVSEYGTYSLYMLDEYGNWGVSEVTIEEPAPEPDITEP